MSDHLSPVEQALALRQQAADLLSRAHALDKLNHYLVLHEHSFGSSVYLLWAEKSPSQEEATLVLDSRFEPKYGEYLTVFDEFTMSELTGVSVSHRLPELIERHDHPTRI